MRPFLLRFVFEISKIRVCCKTSFHWASKTRTFTDFVKKSRITYSLLQFLQQLFTTCKDLICTTFAQHRYSTGFAAMFLKQDARFCFPFYRTFRLLAIVWLHLSTCTHAPISHLGGTQSNITGPGLNGSFSCIKFLAWVFK